MIGVLTLLVTPLYIQVAGKAKNPTSDTYSFYQIIYDVSHNRTFDEVKYNCWDFSTDMVKALQNAGYNAKIVLGGANCTCEEWNKTTCTGSHAWVELDLMVEATNGQILSPESYNRCYTFGYYGMPKVNAFK